jgi:hypothetical protein
LLEFLDSQLRQADTAWSVGSFGAVAHALDRLGRGFRLN